MCTSPLFIAIPAASVSEVLNNPCQLQPALPAAVPLTKVAGMLSTELKSLRDLFPLSIPRLRTELMRPESASLKGGFTGLERRRLMAESFI